MAAFTSVDDVKAWLGISASTDDALLAKLITAASAFIETWISRTIAQTTYTAESYDGTGGVRLSLRSYPALSVSAVTIDGVSIPQATTATMNGWVLASSRSGIALRGYTFTDGIENVTVTYSAGYATTPADVEQACKELVGLRYKERDRIGYVSKSVGGEVVAYSQKDMSESVKTLLNAYREVRPL